MRQVWLNKDDFEMFHQDISPLEYEFFRTHVDTFKRMWKEQTKRFWSMFLSTFEHFIWKHGCIKDFPMKSAEVHKYIDEILEYLRDQFVCGKVSSAKNLIYDCVVVTQNRHCITILDRATYSQNPFYMKETREVFRQLFGSPSDKKTYMKVLCGLPMYVKFAGSVVVALRRWMEAPEINPEDETAKKNYFDNIFIRHKPISEFMGAEDYGKITDKHIAGLTRDCLEASARLEANEMEKKKRKKKKKASKSSKDTSDSTSAAAATAGGGGKVLAVADKLSDIGGTLLTASLKTDRDSSSKTGAIESDKDKASKLSTPDDGARKLTESSESSKSDSDTLDRERERERNEGHGKASDGVKVTQTSPHTKNCLKEPSAESAALGDAPLKMDDSLVALSHSTSKETSAMKPKAKRSISKESTESGGEGVEPVANEEGEVAREGGDGGSAAAAARRKLHTCGLCGREEVTAKTFKRCQKCRGKSNPKYYCSRDCQVKDWKTHKLDHKDQP